MHIHSLESSTKYTARKKKLLNRLRNDKTVTTKLLCGIGKMDAKSTRKTERSHCYCYWTLTFFFLSIIFKLDWNNEILDTIEEQMYLWKNLCFVHCNHIIFK